MKKILITGAGSYIGMSVEKWLNRPEFVGKYQVDTVDMRGNTWKRKDFSGYDTVFHVAGIAHADIGKVTEEQKKLYYAVNCDLAAKTAEKAKREGVGQFIYMSSIIVYGEEKSKRKQGSITLETKPHPSNFYGDSKWKAEKKIMPLSDQKFHVAILRPPMIYGKGSQGNYPKLSKLAEKLPIFPIVKNQRSMCYIDNLCEFVRLIVEHNDAGIFFPQNQEYVNTSELVRIIAKVKGHRIFMIPGFEWAVKILKKFPGRIGKLAQKAFGTYFYEMGISEYKEDYRVKTLEESIVMTEEK